MWHDHSFSQINKATKRAQSTMLISLSNITDQMWRDHSLSQINKATKRAIGGIGL